MKKPSNRKERIDFIILKQGYDMASLLLSYTDKELRKHFDYLYPYLKDKEDFKTIYIPSTCLRCGEVVIHHFECGCGDDRAVFSDEDWKEEIKHEENTTDRDECFIKNNYSSENI
jgi:hypothetical protein